MDELYTQWRRYFGPMHINVLVSKISKQTFTVYVNYKFAITSPNEAPGVVVILKGVYDKVEANNPSFWAHMVKIFGGLIRKEGVLIITSNR